MVYDDHSTDGTAAVVTQYREQDARVLLLSGVPLPEGWCGKPFACSQLAQAAGSDWLLFLDADTVVGPLITPEEVQRVHAWVAEAVELGGRLLAGGTFDGPVYAPTVLEQVPAAAQCVRRFVGDEAPKRLERYRRAVQRRARAARG